VGFASNCTREDARTVSITKHIRPGRCNEEGGKNFLENLLMKECAVSIYEFAVAIYKLTAILYTEIV